MNKRKILEAARKQAQKGARDRALKEYERLLKLDPRDAKLRLEIGDAYRRWGQLEEAIATYVKVAEQYMAEGFDARAVAVFKQIQNLDPECWSAFEPLAELYQRMGLTSEALQTLQAAADGLHKAGRRRDALELLRKMAALDPGNTTSRLKVAELLRQEGLLREAVDEYEQVAEELERQGERDQATSALERAVDLDPKRDSALTRLARLHLEGGRVERAEPVARRLLDVQPDEARNYEMLAEVYRAQQREDELGEIYRRLAELYRRRGDEDRAREITQRFVPPPALNLADDDLDDGGLLDDARDDDLSSFLEDDDFSSGALLEDEMLAPPDPGTPAPARNAEATVLSPDEADYGDEEDLEDRDPEQLFAEACVYLRYGKRQQAIRNLEAILSRDPENRAALEKQGEAFAEAGDKAAAVRLWLRAAEVAAGQGEHAALDVLRDRIAALDPEAVADQVPPQSEAPEGDPEDEDEIPIEIDVDDEFLDIDDPLETEGADTQSRAPTVPELGDEPSEPGEGLEIELDTDLGGDADLSLGEEGEALETAFADTATGARLEAEAGTASLTEDLEEAAFYRQQGLNDEAEGIYRRVLERAPGHPEALAKLEELAIVPSAGSSPALDLDEDPIGELPPDLAGCADDLDAGDEPMLDPDAAPPPAVGEIAAHRVPETQADLGAEPDGSGPAATFDLAAELADALEGGEGARGVDEASDSFSAVFSEFKEGVARTLSHGDHEAHYDLGLAYREMGLFQDAIGEFRIAMGSPPRRLGCLHMLGLCALEMGQPEQAVRELEQALACDGISIEQKLPIRFDLGRAFEALGDVPGARSAWETVAEIDASFQNVEERLAFLVREKEPQEVEDPLDAEAFESFDDVIEEATRDVPEGPAVVPAPEPEPAAEAEPETPREVAEDPPQPAPRARRRRKISFV